MAQMLVDDYEVNGRRSQEAMRLRVRRLRDYFGLQRAEDITPDCITAFVRSRRGASAATIKYELAMLKRMFRLALRAGKATHVPEFPTVEVRNARKGFFEAEDFERVRSHLPESLRAFAQFAYLTGWRKGEIQALRWAQVDFAAGTIRLEPGTTKNGEGRTFPFGSYPQLDSLLRAQRGETSSVEKAKGCIVPWVFHRRGKRILDLREAWVVACRRAGVPGRIFHDLRRTAVRNLERAGVPRSVAMQLTGHKTESIYRRYAIVSEADLSVGVGKLALLHSTRVPAQEPHNPSRSVL